MFLLVFAYNEKNSRICGLYLHELFPLALTGIQQHLNYFVQIHFKKLNKLKMNEMLSDSSS